jgi:hypothetical protein
VTKFLKHHLERWFLLLTQVGTMPMDTGLANACFYWLLLFSLIDSTIGNVELFHSGVATVIIGG